MNRGKSQLLNRLQAADFVLHETVLYLDGHPTDKRALAFFEKAKASYEALKAEYEKQFGPQTAFASGAGSPWEWVQGAWPWQNGGKE